MRVPEADRIFLENYQNDKRIRRQALISSIEKKLNEKYNRDDFRVLSYIANFKLGGVGSINLTDVLPFQDAIQNIFRNSKALCVTINSPGGQLNPVEKILNLIRRKFELFYVIIPNAAKSAATMLALGSDKIIMSKDSEIGPIDPQIPYFAEGSQPILIPANSIINSIKHIKKKIEDGEPYQLYIPILANIKPEWLDISNKQIESSKEIAKKWLSSYMLKNNSALAHQIVDDLASTERFKTHDKLISAEEAKAMGLDIDILNDNDSLWQDIWELYYRCEIELDQSQSAKLYETVQSSVNQKVQVIVQKS